METGIISYWNLSKGFGFITPDELNEPDLFFYHLDIEGITVQKYDKVEFEIGMNQKGKCAKKITVLSFSK